MAIVYATFEDMKARFREADLVQTSDADDIADAQPYIELKLAKAGTLIDGYVSAKYGNRDGLPVPALLTELACDIAFFEMFRVEPTEKASKAKDAAVAVLRDIASGKMKIDEGVIDAQPARPGAVLISGPGRIFGRDGMGGY